MGSQLTKNYDVEKEAFIQGGLHQLWRVHRAHKKPSGDDVCIFMFDKKLCKVSKQLTAQQQTDLFECLKKDAQNLTKFRHPNILHLIEAPIEDKSMIAYVSEAFEYNLASLATDLNKKELVPSAIDVKCIVLELIEIVNFLHANTKTVHLNLAPEHIYVTRDGKMKLAGLNFIKTLTSADPMPAQWDFLMKVGDQSMVPNLQFSAPEISSTQSTVTCQADIFSIGCLIYYLVALSQGIKDPHIISINDLTSAAQHRTECINLESKLSRALQPLDPNLQQVLRGMLHLNANQRGSLNQYVQNPWFQDPLLKTIRYMENIHQKEPQQKVQFLNSVPKVLPQFEKRTLTRKVIPLLMEMFKDVKLSPQVLACLFLVLQKEMLTVSEFRQVAWPPVVQLCKSKELPAQSIFYLVKNSETIAKYAPTNEFQQLLLPLLQKSLECGVPKLQLLALDQIKQVFAKLNYKDFTTQLLPRMMALFETASTDTVTKIRTLECLAALQDTLDANTLQNTVFKQFEKIRQKETDPQVCLLILGIYEKASDSLNIETIGVKVLPSVIPLMVVGNLSKTQFQQMMSKVKTLLDKIEKQRMQTLPDTSKSAIDMPRQEDSRSKEIQDELGFLKDAATASSAQEDFFAGIVNQPSAFSAPPTQVFQPVTPVVAQTMTAQMTQQKPSGFTVAPQTMSSQAKDPFSSVWSADFGGSNNDPFASLQQQFTPAPSKDPFAQDPFANLQPKQQQQQQQDPFASLGFPTSSQPTKAPPADPFSSLIQPQQQQQQKDFFAGFN